MHHPIPDQLRQPQPPIVVGVQATAIARRQTTEQRLVRVYRELLPSVYGYVLFRIRDKHEAEDLTAQVFEHALTRLASVRKPDSLRAWVFAIARNAIIDHYRRARAAFDLLNRLQPTVTIWYHQHQNLVDESGGDVAIERRYADLVGLSLRRLTRYAGSATGWQNATMSRRTTAFVVELPAGQLSSASAARYARAVLQLL